MGSYNTIKATLSHTRASKGAYIFVSATLHYKGIYIIINQLIYKKEISPFFLIYYFSLLGTSFQAHVSAAKAGVDALSAVLAVEEGPNGIRSNVIAPGPIMGTEGFDRLAVKKSDPLKNVNHPVGRLGRISDIENATIFLFSDAAAYITGQVLAVDGGTMHFSMSSLPYPASVINPESVAHLIRPKM